MKPENRAHWLSSQGIETIKGKKLNFYTMTQAESTFYLTIGPYNYHVEETKEAINSLKQHQQNMFDVARGRFAGQTQEELIKFIFDYLFDGNNIENFEFHYHVDTKLVLQLLEYAEIENIMTTNNVGIHDAINIIIKNLLIKLIKKYD